MKINGETLLYYYNKEVNWMLETREAMCDGPHTHTHEQTHGTQAV